MWVLGAHGMYIDLSMLYICVSAPGWSHHFMSMKKPAAFSKAQKCIACIYSMTVFADASPIVSNLDLAAFFLKAYDVLLTTYEMVRNDRAKFSDRETICFSGA